jgi:hypothetical protein
MSCERYHAWIHERIDGTLGRSERRQLDDHLAGCAGCRSLALDLARIREVAGALERAAPPAGAWTAIASRLEAERKPSRRTSAPAWRWMAAAAVLALATAATLYVLVVGLPVGSPSGSTDGGAPDNAARGALVESAVSELQQAEDHYEKAIAMLQEIAAEGEDELDPDVAAVLRRNLTVIDEAIAESRTALRSQPASVAARESLFELFRRKVGLLQDTIALVNEMRKGNQAGAARIAEGLNKS